ncbi:DUF3575 domain-containing protein [Tamlana sp. 2_MG-2023]|uniref:DUF3575 domain-containing protein n=1 Tax=unclassified Tamlana TaxID=2614803 RepID=UPI0026E17B04|nr:MULTISPECIES: DUF3575 domain-containing protein [unclassified Tamlana]MDO6761388.1 DUF3575 domain-containing protein [Tamlana sp. 2_MG-2023]MDO6791998.1 DUF3575 domain-containing protein [Tamlana sp. 1_MG-2023]
MKNTFALLLFSLITLGVYSQESTSNHKNEIGFVVTDLIDGSIQLRYERLISDHFSIDLGLGYKGTDGIVKLSGLDTEKIKTSDITYTGVKVIPEVRYYLNNIRQTGMNGFYMGAYVKYSGFKSDLDGEYINDSGTTYDLEFDAKINVTSVGFMIGYKLPVTKKFAIDFMIAGPGAGFYNFSLSNKKDLPDEFYDDLNEALDKYSLFDLLNSDFRFSQIKRSSDLRLLSFRYGITATYAF